MIFVLFSGAANAHDGHGAAQIHLHWWEYALVFAAVAALAAWLSKR